MDAGRGRSPAPPLIGQREKEWVGFKYAQRGAQKKSTHFVWGLDDFTASYQILELWGFFYHHLEVRLLIKEIYGEQNAQ